MSNPRATFTNRNKTALFKEGNIPIVFENRNPTIVFKFTGAVPAQGFPFILPYILS